MNKFRIKEQLRKIRWATEHQTGKRLGKKGLIDVQKVVMDINKIAEVAQENPEVLDTNWKEKPQKPEAMRLKVNLSNLIGNKF